MSTAHDVEAVRLLIEARGHHILPAGAELLDWLGAWIEPARIEQLVHALGTLPCQFCDKGLNRCEACDPSAASETCVQCLGFGRSRCDFCSGTGLAAYDFLPMELWTGVIGRRTKLAASLAGTLLRQPMPCLDDPHAQKHLHDRLVNANKLLSVFENAVSAADALATQNAEAASRLRGTRDECFRIAGGLETRARDCLRVLAMLSRDQASPEASDSPPRHRSEFLESLADSPGFEKTMLAHPCLFDQAT